MNPKAKPKAGSTITKINIKKEAITLLIEKAILGSIAQSLHAQKGKKNLKLSKRTKRAINSIIKKDG